jgi:hypothetical protein
MSIQENLIKQYNGETFVVNKINGVSKMIFSNGDWLENKEYYGKIFLGDCVDCKKINKLYKNAVFDKILIAGLGMGLLPNYAKHIKNCSVVDVIEQNKELINYVDYLDNSINIIEADAYNYIPSKKYNLIIFDLWWNEKNVTLKIQKNLKKIYKEYLENSGKIIFPLINK